jgi:hypothetical protein
MNESQDDTLPSLPGTFLPSTSHPTSSTAISPESSIGCQRSRHRTIFSRGRRYPASRERRLPNSRPAIAQEECLICRVEQSYFPKTAPTTNCEHDSEVCHDCLCRLIEEAVQSRNFGGESGIGIRCPTLNCTQWMEHSDIQKWADPEIFQRSVQRSQTRLMNNADLTWYLAMIGHCCKVHLTVKRAFLPV